jgi:hypothetical protein
VVHARHLYELLGEPVHNSLTITFFGSIGAHSNLDFHLQGAPNFRMVDLNVYGVAQPTV